MDGETVSVKDWVLVLALTGLTCSDGLMVGNGEFASSIEIVGNGDVPTVAEGVTFLSDGTVVRLGDMAMADGLVACADDDTIDIVLADKDDILVMDAAGSSDGAA
jgi:hypothetical protein